MDPQAKSILTSVLMGLATSVATWAATVGIIPASQESTIANALVAGLLYLAAGALVWYKQRSHNQTNLIAAVNNADNGLKVVVNDAASAQIAPVAAPVKGPEAIVPALTTTASAFLVGAMVVGALALGSPSTARAADSVKPGAPMTLPIDPLGLNSKTGKAALLTGNVVQDTVTVNQTLLANVVSQLKVVADQFSGDADAAVQAALSEPNPDGNGYACWTQAKAFTAVYAAHPAALTGQAMTDQEYLRKMLIAANQLCASEACREVSNESVAQIAKVATLANVAGVGGVVGSAAGAVAAMSVTNNPFTLVCSYITPISVVAPPAGAAAAVSTPTPTPTATGN